MGTIFTPFSHKDFFGLVHSQGHKGLPKIFAPLVWPRNGYRPLKLSRLSDDFHGENGDDPCASWPNKPQTQLDHVGSSDHNDMNGYFHGSCQKTANEKVVLPQKMPVRVFQDVSSAA